jgi:VWFA-related protein
MSWPRGVWFCLAFAAVAWPQTAPPVLKSETRVVLVDAVVTDKKGEYVHGLTAKDFRVWEDNKEQTIQSFSLESAAGTQSVAGAPRSSYMVLVLDYSGMDAGDQIHARQEAARFIDANVGDTNAGSERLMALATFDGGFRIVQ